MDHPLDVLGGWAAGNLDNHLIAILIGYIPNLQPISVLGHVC